MMRLLICIGVLMTVVAGLHLEHKFEYQLCDELHCVDPVWSRGPCSLICPQGQTCRHSDGTVLKANKIHDINGQKCMCKDPIFPDWDLAYCTE